MKLTQKALKAINNPVTRRRLMDVLGCTEFTIARYIQKNSDNLTKAAAMQVIRQVTGMADSEILDDDIKYLGELRIRRLSGESAVFSWQTAKEMITNKHKSE
jgi:hypothetical protein